MLDGFAYEGCKNVKIYHSASLYLISFILNPASVVRHAHPTNNYFIFFIE